MKKFLGALIVVGALLGSVAIAASIGTIDPSGAGQYKAAFLDHSVMTDTSINFGKFTTESQYNIKVTNTELRGYAWGSSAGYMVMNCLDTTSGCSPSNGNFKVANDGTGNLSGYAWGSNTGWVNFGPFTNTAISTVKIGTDGNFGGTSGTAGYAWSQTYGWIVFDCSNANTCVHTDWAPTSDTGGITGGGGGSTTTTPPAEPPAETPPPTTPTPPETPHYTPPANNGATGVIQPIAPPKGNPTTLPPVAKPIGKGIPTGIFDRGLQLPPGVVKVITDSAHVAAVAVPVVGVAASGIFLLLFTNPLSFIELLLLPIRLWTLFLIFIGFKKRSRPWGTVYDSVTKQPIDPAYVMVTDMEGNEVATSITDINGRYGFTLNPGTYKIIANKTNYEFPSKKLAGKINDELYQDLYFGETIVITEEGAVLAKNIPLDQLNFDWNEFAKNEQKRLSYFKQRDVVIARLANIFFWSGFAVATITLAIGQTVYNGVVFSIYVVMFVVKYFSVQFKAKGSVTEIGTGTPLSFSIIHVLSLATGQEVTHKVADRLGNYYCLVPNGTYTIVIDKKNPDGTYTKFPISDPVTTKKGYLKEDFRI